MLDKVPCPSITWKIVAEDQNFSSNVIEVTPGNVPLFLKADGAAEVGDNTSMGGKTDLFLLRMNSVPSQFLQHL